MFLPLLDQEWLMNINNVRNQVIAEQKERKAVLKYSKDVELDGKNRCSGENSCRFVAYKTAVNELLAFEQKKKEEKQKRMGSTARPTLSASVSQPAKKNYADYTPAELKKLQEQNTKKLQQMQQADSEEFEGD